MKKSDRPTQESELSELLILRSEADACARRGAEYDLQEKPDLAEYQYLQAFRCNEQLLRITGDPVYADAAADCCASLADVCMQQGNMHGADRYYAQILKYRSQKQKG